MNSFVKDILSTVDNQGWELSRVLWAVGVVAFIAYAGVALFVLKQTWNAVEYGTGFGAVMVAGGIATAAKDKARTAGDCGEKA